MKKEICKRNFNEKYKNIFNLISLSKIQIKITDIF